MLPNLGLFTIQQKKKKKKCFFKNLIIGISPLQKIWNFRIYWPYFMWFFHYPNKCFFSGFVSLSSFFYGNFLNLFIFCNELGGIMSRVWMQLRKGKIFVSLMELIRMKLWMLSRMENLYVQVWKIGSFYYILLIYFVSFLQEFFSSVFQYLYFLHLPIIFLQLLLAAGGWTLISQVFFFHVNFITKIYIWKQVMLLIKKHILN